MMKIFCDRIVTLRGVRLNLLAVETVCELHPVCVCVCV